MFDQLCQVWRLFSDVIHRCSHFVHRSRVLIIRRQQFFPSDDCVLTDKSWISFRSSRRLRHRTYEKILEGIARASFVLYQ